MPGFSSGYASGYAHTDDGVIPTPPPDEPPPVTPPPPVVSSAGPALIFYPDTGELEVADRYTPKAGRGRRRWQ